MSKGSMIEIGYCTINVKAYSELKLELIAILSLIGNMINTYPKHDIDDGKGKVWSLIRQEYIYKLINSNTCDKTIGKYISSLHKLGYIDIQKNGLRDKYFKMTDKGKNLIIPKEKKEKKNDNLKEKSVQNEKKIVSEGKCPICGEDLIKRKGKNGEFIGCNAYPKCNYSKSIIKVMVNASKSNKAPYEGFDPEIYAAPTKKKKSQAELWDE